MNLNVPKCLMLIFSILVGFSFAIVTPTVTGQNMTYSPESGLGIEAANYSPPGTTSVLDTVIDLPQNYVQYYWFEVPFDAINVALTGRYEVHGGLIEQSNVAIADSDSCPSPRSYTKDNHPNCIPNILNEVKSLGIVNIGLTSGKTYYLIFFNEGFLGERKQIEAKFDITYSSPNYDSMIYAPANSSGTWIGIAPGSQNQNNGQNFVPKIAPATRGIPVTWINHDTVVHSLTFGSPETNSGFALSSNIQPESTIEHTFQELGSFDYYCSIHPYIKGKIIVNY